MLTGLVVMTWPLVARAQDAESDQPLGQTVQSRGRPEYVAPGIQFGSFDISPRLDQSLLYNSNPTGLSGPGSWGSRTTANVSAASVWSRNSLNMSLGVDNFEFFSLPELDRTDWNVGLGGGYTIGDSPLVLTYSHQSYHELGVSNVLNTGISTVSPAAAGSLTGTSTLAGAGTTTVQAPTLGRTSTSLGTVQTATPILDQTDIIDANYTFVLSRFSVTPDLSASSYQFGTATVAGASLDQSYLDRHTYSVGVTTRYSMSDVGGLLLVLEGVDNNYTHPQTGVPSNDSKNYFLMGGIDYQAKGVWRYQIEGGVEFSTFSAPQYSSATDPIVSATVIWTPTGVLTATGTLSRAVQAPQSAGTNGFVLTSANLVVDYELERNILLQGRGGAQYAQYLQGGAQSNFTLGGGVSWLLNRKLRLSLDYDSTRQSGAVDFSTPSNLNTLVTSSYSQTLVALTLHVAL